LDIFNKRRKERGNRVNNLFLTMIFTNARYSDLALALSCNNVRTQQTLEQNFVKSFMIFRVVNFYNCLYS